MRHVAGRLHCTLWLSLTLLLNAACDDETKRTDSDQDASTVTDASHTDAGHTDAASPSNLTPGHGRFPAIDEPSAAGPFAPITVEDTGPDGVYTLFRPEQLAADGTRNPVVTWGNGGFTTPADYPLLPHLASHGFVVIAANNTLVTGPEVRAGLDWIAAQAQDEASDLFEKLDLEHVAGLGYSNGGLATLSTADDERYDTLVIISGATMNETARSQSVPKIHTPTAFLCTDDDASENNCAGDYAAIDQPAFFGVMNGSVHTSVTTFASLGEPEIMTRLAGAATAWLRWQLMDDQSFKATFIGDDCGLCQDEHWTVQPQKNLK